LKPECDEEISSMIAAQLALFTLFLTGIDPPAKPETITASAVYTTPKGIYYKLKTVVVVDTAQHTATLVSANVEWVPQGTGRIVGAIGALPLREQGPPPRPVVQPPIATPPPKVQPPIAMPPASCIGAPPQPPCTVMPCPSSQVFMTYASGCGYHHHGGCPLLHAIGRMICAPFAYFKQHGCN
jgi:hypothetical protein